jgi:hypothetical protein
MVPSESESKIRPAGVIVSCVLEKGEEGEGMSEGKDGRVKMGKGDETVTGGSPRDRIQVTRRGALHVNQ